TCAIASDSGNQSPAEEYEWFKNKYPDENAVITDYKRTLRLKVVADTLQAIIEQYQEIILLQNAGSYAKDKAYSSSFSKVEDIEAYTLVPGKKKYKKIPVEDFKRSFDTNTFVFFDDTEVISYSYPELTEGAKIVTRQVTAIRDPHMIGQFFFMAYNPTEFVQYEIVADKGIEVNHGLFNEEGIAIRYEKTENEDQTVTYRYTGKELPKIESDFSSPAYSYLSPSAYNTVASYRTSGGEVKNVLSSLDDLHLWYRTFVASLTVDEEVRKTAASIVNPDDPDPEKVRKIFYWVQKNVRYIAFEQGMRGFIPHPADYVMEKRYGDCKDMTSILVALLKSQDIDAHFTWIGSRDLPYKYTELPSPVVDNHMIASVELDGQTIFLDATGSYTPLGFPTSMIQGKESLISLGEDYKIVTVPVIPKERNQMIDTAYITIDKGTVSGKGNSILTGLVKVANAYKLINRTEKQTENYLKRLLSRGSNKFFLEEYQVTNVEDFDQPIRIDYKFNVQDYYKAIGDEIYVNLNLDKSLMNAGFKDRKIPIENDYLYLYKAVTVMEIPADYEVSYLPEDATGTSDHFGYEIIYRQEKGQIIATKTISVTYLMMKPSEFSEWNSINKAYSAALRNTAVLKKKTN
ncbi:MAG: transglutaminase domain-containing protein, partial [Cyclobacteriaceae bacterium]